MIKIKYNTDSLELSGHADFADYGKDIVCAAVSTLLTCSVNNIYSIDKESINYKDDGNKIRIEILKNDYSKLIFNNLILMLKELANDYPKNIKIK